MGDIAWKLLCKHCAHDAFSMTFTEETRIVRTDSYLMCRRFGIDTCSMITLGGGAELCVEANERQTDAKGLSKRERTSGALPLKCLCRKYVSQHRRRIGFRSAIGDHYCPGNPERFFSISSLSIAPLPETHLASLVLSKSCFYLETRQPVKLLGQAKPPSASKITEMCIFKACTYLCGHKELTMLSCTRPAQHEDSSHHCSFHPDPRPDEVEIDWAQSTTNNERCCKAHPSLSCYRAWNSNLKTSLREVAHAYAKSGRF